MKSEFTVRLPGWMEDCLANPPRLETPEDRMRFVIDLSRRNVRKKTGGPFAAAVFEDNTNRLVSLGVNLVLSSGLSIAHAEIVALSLAQNELGCGSLTGCSLYTSCQPCAMCLGAIPWSGISQVICGAREEDARVIGFDEGDKPAHWTSLLEKRGIGVRLDMLRDEAREVLISYPRMGGAVY